MAAYYNEIDPYAAQWLRNLIAAGHIAPGDVDTRPIQEVQPDDVRNYTQCHFFAGIGGWSHALRLAGWDDDRPVWTGSCPCQPFSAAAGHQKSLQQDERHLWPHFSRLIRERRPSEIFGEQVDDAIAAGWLDDAFNDMEAENYACAAAVLPAAAVNAPHKRDRIFFVAHSDHFRQPQQRGEYLCASEIKKRQDHYPVYANKNDAQWVKCTDGNYRAIEPGICLLADGIPGRLGGLTAYGNAIVPQVAQAFIQAYRECIE